MQKEKVKREKKWDESCPCRGSGSGSGRGRGMVGSGGEVVRW